MTRRWWRPWQRAEPSNDVVQGLWIGARLGTMERLSLSSFIAAGHRYHLYAYEPVDGVPQGVTVLDAGEILPREQVFVYQTEFGHGSFAAFSDLFRFKLLLDHGGWWVDTDVLCLRHLDFTDPHVLGTERVAPDDDRLIVSTSLLKQPIGSPLMRWAWDECQKVEVATLRWGEIGPLLLQRGVDALGLHNQLQPERTFSPVPHFECSSFVDAKGLPSFGRGVYTVHLWHQMWVHERLDPEGRYPASSFYEQMKRRILGG